MIFLIIFFGLFGFAVDAQNMPDRYMVTDVRSDDVLNVRREPNALSDKIGELGPYTLNVEVLRELDGWGQVPTPEGLGWVSMRYLAENPWPENEIPRPLVCSGTEPFWTFAMYPRGTEYSNLAENDGAPRPMTILSESAAPNGYLIRAQDERSLTRTVMVRADICSDGMSERPFGMSVLMFLESPDGNYVQHGCCTMQVN